MMNVRVGEGDLDIKGLISTLKRTDPGGYKRLKDTGGRLGGKAVVSDKKHQNPNLCAGLQNAKVVHKG